MFGHEELEVAVPGEEVESADQEEVDQDACVADHEETAVGGALHGLSFGEDRLDGFFLWLLDEQNLFDIGWTHARLGR